MMRQVMFWVALVFALLLSPKLHAEMLTLADAEQKAVTNAFEMQTQRLEGHVKEWERKSAVANYLPSLSYTGSYLRMAEKVVGRANSGFDMIVQGMMHSAPPGTPMPKNPNRMYEDSFSHEISLSQPITNGWAEVIAIRMAKTAQRAADLQQQATGQEAMYSTRKAYFDALAARERTAVARKSLIWAKQNLARSRIRYEAGAVPETDLLQWQAEVVQKESDLMQAEATERFMLLVLLQTMGMYLEEADEDIELMPLGTFEQWYERGPASTNESVESNLQLRSIKVFTQVAEESQKLARSPYWPKVNAFYTYSWPAWDKLKPRDDGKGWTAGLSINVPLFSGLRHSTSYRKAQYDYKKTLVAERQVESQLALNLERIALFYKASYKGVKAALKQNELMEKQLAIMQKRYDGGLVNQSQLLEVALGVEQTRIGYIHKLFECLLLEAEYLKTIGGLEVAQ